MALVIARVLDELGDISTVLAPEATEVEIAQLSQCGKAVVVGVRAGDMPRIVAILRAGAADVVKLPLDAVEVVTKLRRAARARNRKP